MVALSKDFFVELSQEEALLFVDQKEKQLNGRIEQLTKKASEVKAHILFIQEAIRELLNITPEKERKTRVML